MIQSSLCTTNCNYSTTTTTSTTTTYYNNNNNYYYYCYTNDNDNNKGNQQNTLSSTSSLQQRGPEHGPVPALPSPSHRSCSRCRWCVRRIQRPWWSGVTRDTRAEGHGGQKGEEAANTQNQALKCRWEYISLI